MLDSYLTELDCEDYYRYEDIDDAIIRYWEELEIYGTFFDFPDGYFDSCPINGRDIDEF